MNFVACCSLSSKDVYSFPCIYSSRFIGIQLKCRVPALVTATVFAVIIHDIKSKYVVCI